MINARTFRGRAGIVALTVLLSAGCSSHDATGSQPASDNPTASTSTAAKPLGAAGAEGSIHDVAWSEVGPGWMLAMWSDAVAVAPGETPPAGSPPSDSPETLYLVNPAGGRYAITTFPSTQDQPGDNLVDWSGDGSHAVFERVGQGSSTAITEVDLHSGTRTTFTVNDTFVSPRFTRPDGKALLLTTKGNGLERVDLSGKPQLTYPTDKLAGTYNGKFLSTPDGTQLVLGTSSGLAMMGNDGTVGKALPLDGTAGCSPVRWWGDGAKIVLATCHSNDQPPQLWQIPVDGQAPTALTAPITYPTSHDNGDVDAWQLPGGTFVQYLGGCGAIYLGKLNPDGTTSKVSVPNVDPYHSIYVIGAHGGNLDLQANVAGCGPAQSLLDYDPVGGTTTVLLGPPLNGGSVIKAVPFKGGQ
jgi:TolB protein